MIDREKVIKGLEEVDGYFHRMTEVCYRGDEATFCDLKEKVADALALLKEDEPVLRQARRSVNGMSFVWVCGACGTDLHPNNNKARFCTACGRAVRWE